MEDTVDTHSVREKSPKPPKGEDQLNTTIIMEVTPADEEDSLARNITSRCSTSTIKANDSSVNEAPSHQVTENDGKDEVSIDENKMDESTNEDDHKEQKTLSREMRSLINSAKDSKIISEFTQIKTKMRKPKKEFEVSVPSLNMSIEAEKLQGSRRSSNNSLVSNSSDISDKAGRRSMRSLNPEFVNKQRKFLNSLSGKPQKEETEVSHEISDLDTSEDEPSASNDRASNKSRENAKTDSQTMSKQRWDKYCWRCHWLIETPLEAGRPPQCSVCPRSYHPKCLNSRAGDPDKPGWACPECMTVLQAENSESRSPAMQKTSLSTLCTLLNYALARMKLVKGVEVFLQPVDTVQCPDYTEHVVRPMDLSKLQQNIVDGLYGSTEAFLADTIWIQHNCLVYNSLVRSNLTGAARALVRECRNQMGEIEACPECYAAAHARRPTWFTDVCSTPHILLWAKLKGFPFWPAKGMSINELGMVDVRFFGDHDRAWVPAKYCYLYSQKDPNNTRTQRSDILESVKEAELHIKSIIRKFGSFVHALPRTALEPARQGEQLKMMIPGYQGALPAPRLLKDNVSSPANKAKRQRSNSKGSKDSVLDGYVTEEEEAGWRRKEPDDNDTTQGDDNTSVENSLREKSIEVEEVSPGSKPLRKRRRTILEEATAFSVLEPSHKKKRTCSHDTALVKEHTNESLKEEDLVKIDEKTPTVDTSAEGENKFTKVTDKVHEIPQDKVQDNPRDAVQEKPQDNVQDKFQVTESDKSDKTELDNPKKDKKIQDIAKSKEKITPTNNKLEQDNTIKPNKSPKSTDKPRAESTPKQTRDRIVFVDDLQSKKPRTKKTPSPEKKTSEPKSPESLFSCGDQMPTITNVCSLAPDVSSEKTSAGKSSASVKSFTPATVVETNPHSRIFKVSKQGESVSSMKEAVAKLQQLRSVEPLTPAPAIVADSFPATMQVDIEIKPEPIDYDDVSNTVEKNDLLGSLNLRPTSSVDVSETNAAKSMELRTIRRVVGPKSGASPRARKTFPQPRRTSALAEESRVDLNGKNSMVYIPIQPPVTQAPVRVTTGKPSRNTTVVNTTSPQRTVPFSNSSVINTVTTTALPLPSVTVPSPLPMVTVATNLMPTLHSSPPAAASPAAPTSIAPTPILQNVPMLSTVNGQWTLCLPPLVNLESMTQPMVNGLSEKTTSNDTGNNTSRPVVMTASPVNTNTNQSGGPPPLKPRPGHPLDPATPIGPLPVPSVAGPCSLQINQSAVKLADYFRNLLTESLQVLEDPTAAVTSLRLQLEQAAWKHKQELAELKHNADVQVVEMRSMLEREKAAAVAEARRVAEIELTAAVSHAKSKQWCANCRQESQFYCCWNTSYCDYPCQQAHWAQHLSVCTQQRNPEQSAAEESTMQQVKTVGGKIVARPANSILRAPGPSMLRNASTVNMQTGNTSSIGYKRPSFNPPAFIINKQLMSTEDTSATTKMTPGGYLIVGGGNSGRPVVSHAQHTTSL